MYNTCTYFVLVVRDLDGQIYFKELNGCILAGGFELEAKPAFENMKCPGNLQN